MIIHKCLSPMLDINRYSSSKIEIVSPGDLDPKIKKAITRFPVKPLQSIARKGASHLSVAVTASRTEECDAIVILEFSPPHMYLANLLLWLSRKRVFLIMHGTQQLATQGKLYHLSLLYFKLFRFETIQFEIGDSVLPEPYRVDPQRNLVIPMPCQELGPFRLQPTERLDPEQPMIIGVFGIFRQGKPTERVAQRVNTWIESGELPNCQLHLGTPLWQDNGRLGSLGLPIRDTREQANYYSFLKEIDIAVFGFDRLDYYYRPSGTIADAASCGAHIVCPNYPIFHSQVSQPVPIGTTYDQEETMVEAILKAIEMRKESGQDNHYLYREARSTSVIAALFDQYLSTH